MSKKTINSILQEQEGRVLPIDIMGNITNPVFSTPVPKSEYPRTFCDILLNLVEWLTKKDK